MNEESQTSFTAPQPAEPPKPPVKRSRKTGKILGVVLLILVLVTGSAAGVYFWQQNELSAQKKNFESQLAAAQAGSDATQQSPANDSRPAHEQTPPKTGTETTCNADELSLSLAESNGSGAGTLAISIVLTNTGKRTCILGGYPGVSLVNDNGNQIGSPADRMKNATEKKVTLNPNGQAKATVTYHDEGNYDAGTCKEGATKLRVYPPNDTGYLSVTSPMINAWCPGFEVSTVE